MDLYGENPSDLRQLNSSASNLVLKQSLYKVKLKGKYSDNHKVYHGVPQGSILGSAVELTCFHIARELRLWLQKVITNSSMAN
jgi:hypothetical protein